MSKRQWLCVLGVWVMVFLFLGVPSLWHKILALVTGLVIVAIAYNVPQERKSSSSSTDSVFTENDIHSPLV